jgi:transcriptional regulator with XRE-family HTH domain
MNTKSIKYGLKELVREFGPLSFGKLLESYRLSEEMSQKEFSKHLGISQASLCDLEKGRRIPSPERASRIAKKLNEPESYWVQLALQDQLNEAGLKFKVSIA